MSNKYIYILMTLKPTLQIEMQTFIAAVS